MPTKPTQSPKVPTDGYRLVVVESPTKARTITRFLGPGWMVDSSAGHIRDLPGKKTDVPASLRDRFGKPIGIDVEGGFVPYYCVDPRSKPRIKALKEALKGASELLLATDEDREGEAIAWHLLDELKPKVPVRRMVFHEITEAAIRRAAEQTRDIDMALVDAQEARRMVDRLYGYEVSPVLWQKVKKDLSAGRVQSVALRLLVDREQERIDFVPADYWDVTATFDAGPTVGSPRTVVARLTSLDGRRVAGGGDFGPDGAPKRAVAVLDEAAARAVASAVVEAAGRGGVTVASRTSDPFKRTPYAPFRTTTLQQEASRKLGFGAAKTMQVAQRLYESGYITYMRTDSVTLSDTAIAAARRQVADLYGAEYLPAKPRSYQSKVKNAQEAHEAIRPAGEFFRTPSETGLVGDDFRLYELVWQRTVASQMKDALGQAVKLVISAATAAAVADAVEFAATGRVITFPGFLRVYDETSEEPEAEAESTDRRLPDVAAGHVLSVAEAAALVAAAHRTRPPARYTEASLVKTLEDKEIGRPSTYASIIKTLLDREYAFKSGNALVPAWLGFSVIRLLDEHFTDLVDYNFTARMEANLDAIARGEGSRVAMLERFWHGDAETNYPGLHRLVAESDIDARALNTRHVSDTISLRVGKFGPYLESTDGRRASLPPEKDLPPDALTPEIAEDLLNRGSTDRFLGTHPESGRPIVVKNGRFGAYVAEVVEEGEEKGRTGSLLKGMDPETVSFETAVQLLSLPRTLGVAPDGEPVTAHTGRYGAYVKKGSESRSLTDSDQVLTINLEDALALLALPKARGGRTATAPLAEFGADPVTGTPLRLLSGRFGPYVTDGTTNATVPRGEDPATITAERAAELIATKREAGPAKRPARARTTKATAAKKPAATTAKKTAATKKATGTTTRAKAAKSAADVAEVGAPAETPVQATATRKATTTRAATTKKATTGTRTRKAAATAPVEPTTDTPLAAAPAAIPADGVPPWLATPAEVG